MWQARSRMAPALAVALVVIVVSAGFFALQYAQASLACSASFSGSPCSGISTSGLGVDALLVALAGLLAAVVMAAVSGVSPRASQRPNTALAQQIEAEDAEFKVAQARKVQMEELRALALAHAAADEELAAEAAAKAKAAAALAEMDPAELAAAIIGDTRGALAEDNAPETPDQARRRVLSERLKNLAKNKPETVAEVIKTWIDQPRLRG